MARDPFAFLDASAKERTLLVLLLAMIRKSGGEVELDLSELTSISDGDSFLKYPSERGDKLVLRYARKGAEAYFLGSEEASPPSRRPTIQPYVKSPLSQESPRNAVHDDVDLAMREEEMASRAERAQADRLRQARAAAGVMPWRTETKQ